MRAVIAIAVITLSGAAVAQPKDCQAITDPKERLACFDARSKIKPKAKDTADPLFAKARAAVTAKLRDPDSARFADLKRTNNLNTKGIPTLTVCGTVNAKNAYGGYIGAAPFVYFPATNDAHIVSGSETDIFIPRAIYRRFCLGIAD